jgi:hypothetical protein
MSTDYRPLTPIRFKDLFDGRLAEFGVLEHHSEEATSKNKCLTDGRNFLWAYCDEKSLVSTFTRYMTNGDPEFILDAIRDEFDVDIVSEYEPDYWGFATKEEWDAAMRNFDKKLQQDEQHFWNEVVRYAKGETAELEQSRYSDSVATEMAQIAKNLISESPDLLAEDKRPNLIKAVHEKHHQHLVAIGEIPF